MKQSISILSVCVGLIVAAGCNTLDSYTLSNGRLDVAGQSIDYSQALPILAEAYYPGAAKLLRGLQPAGESRATVPPGYAIEYEVRDDAGELVDLRSLMRIPKLVRISDDAGAVITPDDISVEGVPDVPADVMADVSNLIERLSRDVAADE